MTIGRFELPYMHGDLASLHSLKNTKYNDENVMVGNFNNDRLRFVVTLINGKSILVKACNLVLRMDFGPHDELIALYNSLGTNVSVAKLEEVWVKMQAVCDNRRYLATCLRKILNRLCFTTCDHSIMSKFLLITEDLMGSMSFSREKIILSIAVSTLHTNMGNDERARKILFPFFDKHYGYLMQIMVMQETTILLQYLPKIEFLLKHGLYAFSENIMHHFVTNFLDYVFLEPKYLTKARTMTSFLKDELDGLMGKEENVKTQRMEFKWNIEAKLAIMEERFEDAIANLTARLNLITSQFGRDADASFAILEDILWCYVKFGDKTSAEQTVKRMKRVKKNDPRIVKHENWIAQMEESGKRSRTKVGRTLCKCSNPYCAEVERKKGEFSLCAKCERVKYCSKECQKQHWKVGHQKQCGK